MGPRAVRAVAVALGIAIASEVAAQPRDPRASPSSEDVRAAERKFVEGERAFRGRDYLRAADAFEAANELAPSGDALWNAARARHRAGDLARAANLYARFLREAKPGAADRDRATASLKQLAASLARIDVQAASDSVVTIDDAPANARSLYVNPGAHVVRERRGERVREKVPTVTAGQILSVAFADDDAQPAGAGAAGAAQAPGTAAAAATAPPPGTPAASSDGAPGGSPPAPAPAPALGAPREPRAAGGLDADRSTTPSKGVLPPWVFGVEVSLTVVAAGATIASALDTRSARNDFPSHPTSQALSDGKAKELRTNVLLGVTGGLAVLTAVSGIWLVRWRSGGATAVAHASGGALFLSAVF